MGEMPEVRVEGTMGSDGRTMEMTGFCRVMEMLMMMMMTVMVFVMEEATMVVGDDRGRRWRSLQWKQWG